MSEVQPVELVDIRPHYTPASKTSTRASRIPRRFFQTYKSSLFDKAHAARLVVFRNTHPEFDFYFYDDDAMDGYMADHWRQHPIYGIYRNATHGPSKADIWRYCILYQHGGVYLDIDSEILFNMNTIPADIDEAVSFEGNSMRGFFLDTGWPFHDFFAATDFREPAMNMPDNEVLQWLLAFAPGHPILARAIELIVQYAPYYCDKTFDSVMHAVMGFAGPPLFTQAVWEYRRAGHAVAQFGRDFNGLARFKAIENLRQGVYASDPHYYARKRNDGVYRSLARFRILDDREPGMPPAEAFPAPAWFRWLGLAQLPSQRGADEIELLDLLEGFAHDEALQLVERCCAALAPGGSLLIRTLCLDAALEAYRGGHLDIAALNRLLFASESGTPPAAAPRPRRCVLSTQVLVGVLERCGMSVVYRKNVARDAVLGAPTADDHRVRIKAKKTT